MEKWGDKTYWVEYLFNSHISRPPGEVDQLWTGLLSAVWNFIVPICPVTDLDQVTTTASCIFDFI